MSAKAAELVGRIPGCRGYSVELDARTRSWLVKFTFASDTTQLHVLSPAELESRVVQMHGLSEPPGCATDWGDTGTVGFEKIREHLCNKLGGDWLYHRLPSGLFEWFERGAKKPDLRFRMEVGHPDPMLRSVDEVAERRKQEVWRGKPRFTALHDHVRAIEYAVASTKLATMPRDHLLAEAAHIGREKMIAATLQMWADGGGAMTRPFAERYVDGLAADVGAMMATLNAVADGWQTRGDKRGMARKDLRRFIDVLEER